MITQMLLKYHELIDVVREYESDTFSASGSKLKRGEAKKIAEKLVVEDIQSRIDMERMDGLDITDLLEEIREKK